MVSKYVLTERFVEGLKNRKIFSKKFKEKMKDLQYDENIIDYDHLVFFDLMVKDKEFIDFVNEMESEHNVAFEIGKGIGALEFILNYGKPQDLYNFLKKYYDYIAESDFENKGWRNLGFTIEEMKFWLRGHRNFSFEDPELIKRFKEEVYSYYDDKYKYFIGKIASWYVHFKPFEINLFLDNYIRDLGKARKLKENGVTNEWLEVGMTDFRKIEKLKKVTKRTKYSEEQLPSLYENWKVNDFTIDELNRWYKQGYIEDIEPEKAKFFKEKRISPETVNEYYKKDIKDTEKILEQIKINKKEKRSKTSSIMKDIKLKREIFDYVCGAFVIDTRDLSDVFDIDIRIMYKICYELAGHDLLYSERQESDGHGGVQVVSYFGDPNDPRVRGAKYLSVAWYSPYEDNSATDEEQDEAFFKVYGTYGKDDE